MCLVVCRQTDRQTDKHTSKHTTTSVWPLKKRSSTAPSSPPVESEREFWLVLALALFVIHWLTLFLPYVCVCVVLSVFFHSIPSITDAQSTLRCLSSLQASLAGLPWLGVSTNEGELASRPAKENEAQWPVWVVVNSEQRARIDTFA